MARARNGESGCLSQGLASARGQMLVGSTRRSVASGKVMRRHFSFAEASAGLLRWSAGLSKVEKSVLINHIAAGEGRDEIRGCRMLCGQPSEA